MYCITLSWLIVLLISKKLRERRALICLAEDCSNKSSFRDYVLSVLQSLLDPIIYTFIFNRYHLIRIKNIFSTPNYIFDPQKNSDI